jgi:general secretion pathway protein E
MALRTLKELYDDLAIAKGASKGRVLGLGAAPSDETFVLKVVNLILSYGLQVRASDIHIEPGAAGCRVRYRIDGLLHEMLTLGLEIRDPLIRALKVKASMTNDAVGRSKPQDARVDFAAEGKTVDLRLSSYPTLFGDVMAIRILDRSAPLLSMEQVGFPPQISADFDRLIQRPNGMVLVTGPAGSGKTTTLYAALNRRKSPNIKIVTLEDPVEYQVDGIDQAQVNTSIGLTFASGLRSILRQDANIILVGEIRDKETAEIAIRAALTGHLVLSTMHTRHALGAAMRLTDMGIEPHLILASVTGVLAQRLVRILCPQCKAPDPISVKTFTRLWQQEAGAPPSVQQLDGIRKHVGCSACSHTGFVGRKGIFELVTLTDELKQYVLERSSHQVTKVMVSSGRFRTMLFNGLEKVASGQTTVDEVLRVTGGSEEV